MRKVLNVCSLNMQIIFIYRLDKILFTSPHIRKSYIEEHKEEMTQGFVDYIQQEMRNSDDVDSKVSSIHL
jgi:hypothetical protein